MPTYNFAFELLPNIWIGITPSLTDSTFRKKYYIIRDIVTHSAFSNPVKPFETTQNAEVYYFKMNGNENEIEMKALLTQMFPIITECYEKDRGLLITGESWNSPHIKVIMLWCAKYGNMNQQHVIEKIQSFLPH